VCRRHSRQRPNEHFRIGRTGRGVGRAAFAAARDHDYRWAGYLVEPRNDGQPYRIRQRLRCQHAPCRNRWNRSADLNRHLGSDGCSSLAVGAVSLPRAAEPRQRGLNVPGGHVQPYTEPPIPNGRDARSSARACALSARQMRAFASPTGRARCGAQTRRGVRSSRELSSLRGARLSARSPVAATRRK
jgi:hypothetical protein